ncbi:MAG: DNA polymerase III subunit epsilon [Beijerinckiaceae bacterium]|jgi:DNA polymerase-3 subunit epsilon|nr:DNA polymerase III subunit epsilon [Beijerinckiaceae bacterium]
MREIVLDTETTGLDPLRGDRLVEIGCVEIVNRFVTGQVFHRYINPERPMSPEAFAVHGLSDAFLADKPVFRQIADEFLAFIGDDPLIIHNASFDMGFLNAELKRLKKGPLSADRVIDTLAIARRKHAGQQNSLDALCARYGIDNSRRTRHGALLDAEILAEVYAELTGGKQSSLLLGASSEDDSRSATDGAERAHQRAQLSAIHLITEEERAQHRAFVAEMGEKALWKAYWVEAEKAAAAPPPA